MAEILIEPHVDQVAFVIDQTPLHKICRVEGHDRAMIVNDVPAPLSRGSPSAYVSLKSVFTQKLGNCLKFWRASSI
jgi:hypothetical protein